MADNSVVVRYELDTGQFDAKVEEVVKGYEEMDKASKGANDSASKSAAQLTQSTTQVAQASQTAAKSTVALTQSTGSLAVSTTALGDKFKELVVQEQRAAQQAEVLGKAQTKNVNIFKRVGETIKQFSLGARDGFRTAIKEVGGFSGITTQLGAKFKGFGATASKAFNDIGKGVAGSVSQVPVIGTLAAALGPVGLAAAAVAGGLFKVITNTDAGATALQGLGKTGGVVFDRVTGAVSSFFDTLTSGTGFIGKSFDVLSGAVDFFINKLTPIGAIFEAISNTSLFQGLKEDFEFGQQIANQLDELDDKQRGVNLTVAENEIGIRKNLAALRDTTKSAEERLAIADAITRTEQDNLRLKKELLLEERRIAQQEADRQASTDKGKGEVDDSLKQRITDLNIAVANAEADSVSLTERVATRRAGIVEGEEQRKAAIRQKAIAAREKAEAEQAKKSEQRAQAEAKLNETIAALSQEAFERTLTDSEKEVEAVKQKYAQLEAATLDGIQKLREASPPNAQSQITAKEAEAIIAIETAKNEELLALQVEQDAALAATREEALEGIRQSLLTDTELQREAVLQQLDEQVAAAEKFITNEEERNAVIAELTKNAEAELTGIITDEEAKRREAQEESARKQAELAQQNAALVTSFAEQGLATVISAAAQGKDIQEEAGKQLIGLLLDTLEKIILMNAINAQTGAIAFGFSTGNPIAGIAAGIAVAAVIKGLFGALKSQITANYEGDPYVGGDGSRPTWSGRDGFLRRLDKGERVVTRRTNEEHFPALEAMEGGRFDDWVMANYLPRFEGINDDDRMVQYVNSDMGQRMAQSITLPRMFDKNIVESSQAARKEQQRTNDLLAAMLQQGRPRRRNTRYN